MTPDTFTADREHIWRKFHGPELPAETGLPYGEVKAGATAFADRLADVPRPILKAQAFAFVCRNVRIDVSPHDLFPTFDCWDRNDRPLTGLLNRFMAHVRTHDLKRTREWDALNASSAGNQWVDFDHSVPDWNYILPLGFPGIRKQAQAARQQLQQRQQGHLTPEQTAYYDAIDLSYQAILELVQRLADLARTRAEKSERCGLVADCLQALHDREPRTTYEAMQFIYLYFMFSEHLDRYQVRSLGNLDNLLRPFHENDLRNGTVSKDDLRILWDYFLMQWGAIDNYWGHPFYLGGTDEHGDSRVNWLSYLILEEFDKLAIPTPKIQLKIARNTPDEFLEAALRMIRKGHSSLVFVSEEQSYRMLTADGCTPEDARTCDIRGCYELAPAGYYNGNTTAGGHLNLLTPLPWILTDGVDSHSHALLHPQLLPLDHIRSFDDLYRTYLDNLRWLIDDQIANANDFEAHLADINPSNVFSATVQFSLEHARDAFFNGCFRNTSSLLFTGLASAVDALLALKETVFDRHELTLADFAQCLRNNWAGHERLRAKVLHSPNKFGNGLHEPDELAQRLAHVCGALTNGRPNARNGAWHASGHCAKQYAELGKKTMATPDGRLDGEEMSKNLSPVQGMDRNGLTALIRSLAALDPIDFPGDFPLDVMLHPATVAGDDGLNAWKALLRQYLAHGHAVHFNIFDAQTLRDAQQHPDRYQSLQIRVCGWNVRFTTMPAVEQDMYICRAENIRE